jgi:hypothetical protein
MNKKYIIGAFLLAIVIGGIYVWRLNTFGGLGLPYMGFLPDSLLFGSDSVIIIGMIGMTLLFLIWGLYALRCNTYLSTAIYCFFLIASTLSATVRVEIEMRSIEKAFHIHQSSQPSAAAKPHLRCG